MAQKTRREISSAISSNCPPCALHTRTPPEKRPVRYVVSLLLSQSYSAAILHRLTIEPTPFLNLTLYTGRRARTLSLEPFLIRITRPFTNPWLFVVLAAAYIIGFAFFARAQSFLTPSDSFIGCTATYWAANNGCGLNGESCEPFTNSTFDFRCPAACASVVLENYRTVGDIQVIYEPLIVGGGDDNHTYRGDTFICAAAIQT